jgi:type VI secretion system protein ImpH
MAPAPATAIDAVVTSLFGVPARVEQFLPNWYRIDPDDRSYLGTANARLGIDMNLGEQVLIVQSRFRLVLGPLRLARFLELLPEADGFDALSCLVRLAAGTELDFDIQLILAAADVPDTRLCSNTDASRLGRTSWVKTQPFSEDATAAIFEPAVAPMARSA